MISVPNIVYYNDDHSNTPRCTDPIKRAFECSYTLPSTWAELTAEIEGGAEYLAFHIDMIRKSGLTAAEFVAAIYTIHRFCLSGKHLKIMVIITPATPRKMVEDLKCLRVYSIGLDINHYPIQQVAHGVREFVTSAGYWPEDIIDQLVNPPDQLLCVYFREDWASYIRTVNLPKFVNQLSIGIDFCNSWDELDTALLRKPHQVVVHYDMLKRLDVTVEEIMFMLTTRLTLADLSILIAVGIDRSTPVDVIKQLKQAGVHGIVPSKRDFGIDECVAALHALRDRQAYWPKHIIGQLAGHSAKPAKHQQTDIKMSSRQQQVFNLIRTRGLTNKQIAQALNIAEPTVKMHVSDIMRVHGVRTRVQLAVLS